jgi:hypothetical protein
MIWYLKHCLLVELKNQKKNHAQQLVGVKRTNDREDYCSIWTIDFPSHGSQNIAVILSKSPTKDIWQFTGPKFNYLP